MRAPKAKPGELKVQWGKLKHNNPDICYAWGEGVNGGNGGFMHYVLGCPRLERNFDYNLGDPIINYVKYEKTVLKELDERGFDITTLKFSIQMKNPKK